MTINGSKKRCDKCGKPMQRWGQTKTGKQRWKCRPCSKTGTRVRHDVTAGHRQRLFLNWVRSKESVADTARKAGVTARTAHRWFAPFWKAPPRTCSRIAARILVVDAVSVVKHEAVALLAGDPGPPEPVGWEFAARECHESWRSFFLGLRSRGADPGFVVCDGQKGLLKAAREVFPHAAVQRCVVHVHRLAMAWLMRKPKTAAGRELRPIVSALLLVRTPEDQDTWLESLRSREIRHAEFLKERTYGENGWWYTHRKLRAVRSLLRNAAPDLFRYVDDPPVPRTSNHVEGGLNSRIKELLRSHRGISKSQRMALVCWYLESRREEKKPHTKCPIARFAIRFL